MCIDCIMVMCNLYKRSGNLYHNNLCFSNKQIFQFSEDNEEKHDVYLTESSKNIYIKDHQIFRKMNHPVTNNPIVHIWKQTRDGEWDWFLESYETPILNIDNYLEENYKDIQYNNYKLLIQNLMDTHNHYFSDKQMESIKQKFGELLDTYK